MNNWLLIGFWEHEGEKWLGAFPTYEDAKKFAENEDNPYDYYSIVDLNLVMSNFDNFKHSFFRVKNILRNSY